VLCALAVAGALIDRAWLVTALLIAILVLLLAAPSFFAHYAGYAAAPLLVLVGAGSAALATVVPRGARGRPRELTRGQGVVAGLALGVVPVAVFGSVVAGLQRGTPFPGPQLHDAAASSRCVTADSPVALVQMDLLTRDLERGCRVWIDVTGLTYDTAGVGKPDGEPVSRRRNHLWQRALMGYLLSGNATVVVRSGGDGFAPDSARTLDQLPILARGKGYALWSVPHGSAGLLLDDLRAATL
jgi:alpha-1,2-mannosyltransferase